MEYRDNGVEELLREQEAPRRRRGLALQTVDTEHAEVRDRFSDFIEGTLPDSDKEAVLGHLEHCPGCRATLATFQGTVDLLQSLPPAEAPEEMKTRILDALRDQL